MDWIIFFGSNGMAVRDSCRCQANGIREIEQCGGADEVGPLACQDTECLWKEHIVARCQANAPRRSIKCWQAQISRVGPNAVLNGKMQLSVNTIDALGIYEQNGIVV